LTAEQRAALGRAAGVDVQAAFEHEVDVGSAADVFRALETETAAGEATVGELANGGRGALDVGAAQVDDAVHGDAGLGKGGRGNQSERERAEFEFHGVFSRFG
jgi:hypothetical protein